MATLLLIAILALPDPTDLCLGVEDDVPCFVIKSSQEAGTERLGVTAPDVVVVVRCTPSEIATRIPLYAPVASPGRWS
ncbi:hypothetical protein ElyMa_000216600 [Elysia marginata]|uniref:Uncharacterized protein n=1 Tax=Elysia marginata TaxID=1093978 RepID=A0AAV4EZ32_9GAST|nr:hypothetical protein ElyMa_000216600 [Elysia marginata]